MTAIKLNKKLINFEHIIWAVFFIIVFLVTYHPDLHETANHSYLFLDSIFTGNFFNFYTYVESRPLELYYINNAHYNIIVYILFGIWELPVYIVTKIFSLSINETFLFLYCKVLSVAFFIGCGYLVREICVRLKINKKTSNIAAIFFIFNPIAFFSPVAMGQYDTFCLFFLLLALKYYIDGEMTKFSFVIGISGVLKFFSFLIFIPLLLLKTKKLRDILKHALLSLAVYIPTTLLFLGRTGNASFFTSMMFERLFSVSFDTGFGNVSFFLLAYAVICFYCFLQHGNVDGKYLTMYIPMVIFALLFYCIYWHPQWLILLMPFIVITTFLQKNTIVWHYVDLILCFAFFMTCFMQFPQQFSINMLSGGLIGTITNTPVHVAPGLTELGYFFSLIPFFKEIVSLCFCAALFVNIIFKFPLKNGTLADSISNTALYDKFSYKTVGYIIFIIAFFCFWLVPSVFEYLNAFNIV